MIICIIKKLLNEIMVGKNHNLVLLVGEMNLKISVLHNQIAYPC